MKINKKTATELWHKNYGDARFAKDYSGNIMHINGYGKRNYTRIVDGEKVNCGWNIHHILPKAKGGPNSKQNLACTNFITNDLAADKTTFWINSERYQVKKANSNYTICHM